VLKALVHEVEGTEGELVAKVGVESESSRTPHEYEIYQRLKGSEFVPEIKWFGSRTGLHTLIMKNTGMTLQEFFEFHSCVWPRKIHFFLTSNIVSKMVLESISFSHV
jgi:hypothetical protein